MSKTKGTGSTYSFLDYVRMHPVNFFREVGNGLGYDDCIYQMLQIIMDNSIDEFRCGHGNRVELTVDFDSGKMGVRDYGYGAPVSKLDECFGLHAVGGMYTADAANVTLPSEAAKTFSIRNDDTVGLERKTNPELRLVAIAISPALTPSRGNIN